jgi:hypothetical protein
MTVLSGIDIGGPHREEVSIDTVKSLQTAANPRTHQWAASCSTQGRSESRIRKTLTLAQFDLLR